MHLIKQKKIYLTRLRKVRILIALEVRRIVSVSLSLGRAINILRSGDKSEPSQRVKRGT